MLISDLDEIQNCRQFLILNHPVKNRLFFLYSSVSCFSSLSQSVKYGLSIYRYEILFLTYAHTTAGKHFSYLGQPTLSSQLTLQFKDNYLSFSLPSVQCFQIHPL